MSLDSTLKVWMPESNRSILLNQFFVCVKSVDVRGGGLHGGGHGGTHAYKEPAALNISPSRSLVAAAAAERRGGTHAL